MAAYFFLIIVTIFLIINVIQTIIAVNNDNYSKATFSLLVSLIFLVNLILILSQIIL
jgi:hypothetical protein